MKIRVNFLILLLVSLLSVPAVFGQGFDGELDSQGRWINGVTEPWWFPDNMPAEDLKAAQSLWTSIGSQHAVNDWVGDYFIGGDTHGSYLRWMPGRYVLFHIDKCQAKVMAFSYGTVALSPDLVQLIPEKSASERTKHSHSKEPNQRFLKVTWRQTKYLVPEEEITEFGDYVAGLGKYNSDNSMLFLEYSQFFSRLSSPPSSTVEPDVANQKPDPFVAPLVPAGYEKFIKRPIDGNITAIKKAYVRPNAENEWWNDRIIHVSINVGSANGLKVKMALRLVGTEGFGGGEEYLKITKVGLTSAQGIVVRPVRKVPCVKFAPDDDCKSPNYTAIKVGSKVTTNPFREATSSDN